MTHVIVYGRAPEPGKVKTRLAASLGDRAAAAVYSALLRHMLAQAAATDFPVTLALAEPPSPESAWTPPSNVSVELQGAGDLGARMAASFAGHFACGAEAVVLVGSDAPRLDAALLRRAAAVCREKRVALAPAFDGGYALVAQRAPGVAMFDGVPWSSPDTLARTRLRLRALGVHHAELETLRDIDTGDDLNAALADAALDAALRAQIESALACAPDGRS